MGKDDKIVSMAGNPIYRHEERTNGFDLAVGDGEAIEKISDHIERHIGPVASVFHELISDQVHIDVHYVAPRDDRPVHTLITSGMSDLPMTLPEGVDAPRYMELMITLPASWQVSEEAFQDPAWYWPVRQLKFLARFPHLYSTWLGWAHTMPNGNPPEPYAPNTSLMGALLLPSLFAPVEFRALVMGPEKSVQFLSIWTLYEEEMNYKLRKGAEALVDRFEKYQIDDRVQLKRRNVAKKRFGIF